MHWQKRNFFLRPEHRLNGEALLSAQSGKLESILRPHLPGDLRCDDFFSPTAQRNQQRQSFADFESFRDERSKAALAEVARPALHGKLLTISGETDQNARLKHMPDSDAVIGTH